MDGRRARIAPIALTLVALAAVLVLSRNVFDGDPEAIERGPTGGVGDGEIHLEGRASENGNEVPARPESEAPCAVDLAVCDDDREPLPGATLRAALAGGSVRVATTDEEGEARLDRLPPGPLEVTATRRGYAASDVEHVLAVRDADAYLVLRLEKAAALRGTVVDHRDGRAVAGARVAALEAGPYGMDPSPPQRLMREFGFATADGRGAFAVEGVPVKLGGAVLLLQIQAEGYRTIWHVAPTPGADDDHVVRLVPGGAATGRVLDAKGAPVAGATVYAGFSDDPTLEPDSVLLPSRFFTFHVFGNGPRHPEWVENDAYATLRTRTGADGRFRMTGLGFGERYVFGATAPGHAPSKPHPGVEVRAEPPRPDVTLRLQPACTLVVRCTDTDDLPFPDLEVSIARKEGYGPRFRKVRTDAAGIARLEDLRADHYHMRIHDYRSGHTIHEYPETKPGEQELAVSSPGKRHPPRTPRTKPRKGARPPQTPRPATLVGQIAVPAGAAPPARVRQSGQRTGPGGSGSTGMAPLWAPDGDGTMPIRWTIDWTHYTFTLEAEGFLPIVREVERTAGEVFDLGTLTLDPGQSLVGRVLTQEGDPLPSARIHASYRRDGGVFDVHADRWLEGGEDLFDRHVDTDAAGAFRLAGLPRGRVLLQLEDARFLATTVAVDVPVEDGPLRIVPPTGAWLRLLVVGGEDHPMPRRHVVVDRVLGDGETDSEAWGETDVTGTFRVRVPPGRYRLEVSPDEYRREEETRTRALELTDGDDREVRVVLERP